MKKPKIENSSSYVGRLDPVEESALEEAFSSPRGLAEMSVDSCQSETCSLGDLDAVNSGDVPNFAARVFNTLVGSSSKPIEPY